MTDEGLRPAASNGWRPTNLADWARTGLVIVTIVIAGARWTSNVDNRLSNIEGTVASQHAMAQEAVEATAKNADLAAGAAVRAESAVKDTQASQAKIIVATGDNRKAIDTQTRRVTDLKTEIESLAWRVHMLEEQSRKLLDKR